MKKILIFGGGKSSPALVRYLAHKSYALTLADAHTPVYLAQFPNLHFVAIDIQQEAKRQELISQHDLVISLLPPALHATVARDALGLSKPFLTASYVSEEIRALAPEAERQKVILLMECGLDPGIDHLSAMKEIEDIEIRGGQIKAFHSNTGGLMADASDGDNPWKYKFTWNPLNVVLAGQSGARFLSNGLEITTPYEQLFATAPTLQVEGYGKLEAYPNRDSLAYLPLYGLKKCQTFVRGTLRKPGYCAAWNAWIKLGYTRDQQKIALQADETYHDFFARLHPGQKHLPPTQGLAELLNCRENDEIIQKLLWTGMFGTEKIGLNQASPAGVLLHRLQQMWRTQPGDRDLIVMQHVLDYELKGEYRRRTASLVLEGENELYTAMALTVGLPLAIAAELILQGQLTLTGLHIPLQKTFYQLMLPRLEALGIRFVIKDESI